MTTSVIVAGARTPIGRFLGGLHSLSATELGSIAIRQALRRAAVAPDQVDEVIMGNVIQAGVGPNPARIAAVGAGIPMSAPATTVNKLCLSGLAAIAFADHAIRLGEADIVVAGGMESMSRAPHLLMESRRGTKYGTVAVVDALERDGLVCAFDHEVMGAATERYVAPLGISRERQDEYAVRSHHRAAAATEQGSFADEITPVTLAGGEIVGSDEGIRATVSTSQLGRLRPAFRADGIITAGTSSPLSDGAAAVVVMSKARAEALGVPWLAEIGGYGKVAGPDPSLLAQPANAIIAALKRDGTDLARVNLVEINEAFAAVAIHSSELLGLRDDQVNINGGAVALGHPVGMSGARLVLTLALALQRRGGGTGVAALCGGGGQGDALVLHSPGRGSTQE